jgi:hypothetical protein
MTEGRENFRSSPKTAACISYQFALLADSAWKKGHIERAKELIELAFLAFEEERGRVVSLFQPIDIQRGGRPFA